MLIKKREELGEEEQAELTRLLEGSEEVRLIHRLLRAFLQMLRERQAERLDAWMKEARSSGIKELQSFVIDLEQDYDAVKAELRFQWSQKLSEKGFLQARCNTIGRMTRTLYLTDVSDAEWDCIASLFLAPAAHGRPRLHSPREIFNAILYLLRGGCARRLLSYDLPPWKTVYHCFRLWRKDGLWERLHTTLREQARQKMGRDAQPSAGIIESQSVKTIGLRGSRGYDAGKKIKRRKPHLLVDMQGFVLKAKVHTTDIMDRGGVILFVDGAATQFPRLRHV